MTETNCSVGNVPNLVTQTVTNHLNQLKQHATISKMIAEFKPMDYYPQ